MKPTLMGSCLFCGLSGTRLRIEKHLAACAASHDEGENLETMVLLRVEAAGAPEYWLSVEGRASASLQQLDDLLRRVWLECCGHLSAFRVHRREVSKRTSLGRLLAEGGSPFDYEYDFGSTTALRGKAMGVRQGSMGRRVVRVLAQNALLSWTCENCPSAAEVFCPPCLEAEEAWLFCGAHASGHACAREGVLMRVVNSPRMGVCGYEGPASPPGRSRMRSARSVQGPDVRSFQN